MGPGKTFQQERATLAAHHEALEVDLLGHGAGIDLLDYYRGELSWRRLAVFIRHFQSEPSSATFRSIERAEAPRNTDVAPPVTYYQHLQMLAHTTERELLLIIANEVRTGFAAMAGQQVEPHPRPWERAQDNGERAAVLLAEYNSPEARAAREAVTGTPQPEGS